MASEPKLPTTFGELEIGDLFIQAPPHDIHLCPSGPEVEIKVSERGSASNGFRRVCWPEDAIIKIGRVPSPGLMEAFQPTKSHRHV